jgi:hypothetical protein
VDVRATGAAEPQRVRCTSHALQSHGCHASATTTTTTPKAPHVGEVFVVLLDEVFGRGKTKNVSAKNEPILMSFAWVVGDRQAQAKSPVLNSRSPYIRDAADGGTPPVACARSCCGKEGMVGGKQMHKFYQGNFTALHCTILQCAPLLLCTECTCVTSHP